ncbi:BLUF domain-containing protein [Curtobacterium sp. BH-2-1-1]|uniref:BLUF domain-containing protein n=1 Tax=Curtobacterium sp. BH-2-1-1 TaxID=1905847 RepID=UPI0011A23AD1|nr:BLUF domain-containing protein [Curtobacterium sp. BH-2-1-1]
MELRSMVFALARTGRLSHADLLRTLPASRSRNADLGITGILVLNDVNVLGIAEGPAEAVRARIEAVRADPQNVSVQVLVDDPVDQRAFTDWSISFPTEDASIQATPGFVDLFAPGRSFNPAAAASRSLAILEWFLRTPAAQFRSRTSAAPVRERILDRTIEALRGTGPARCSIEQIARRSDLTVAEVQQHFPTMPLLLAAALAEWVQRVTAPYAPVAHEQGAVAYLCALSRAFAEEPALDRLIVAALATSADPGDPAGEAFLVSYRAFHTTIRVSLEADIAAGREPATMSPVSAAKQLLALFDGLRIQNLFDPDPDLPATFRRAVDRMRTGWSEPYAPADLRNGT